MRLLFQGLLSGIPNPLALPESGKVNFYREAIQPVAVDFRSRKGETAVGRLPHLPSGGSFSL
jgi:hypothetical protein